MSVHVLGIRHHGPGSARHVRQFLEELQPDIVLVEGPPEADALLQWVGHAELKPPVALLVYQPDSPQESSFYPFAEFSPEWQAIAYARKKNIHVRFIDLPATNRFAFKEAPREHIDPIAELSAAAGHPGREVWWEQTFEYRRSHEDVFTAVQEVMAELREAFPDQSDQLTKVREAHMRRTVRQAQKEMFDRIAVICGAWHVPALVGMPPQKEDNELLKGLSKVKVECTWIPWTYGRLSYASGYGAGIASSGWYEHVWHHPNDDGTRWMAKVAALFRKQNMDTSVAHVIEAVRLAGSLAALRGYSKAGLEELNEATLSVLCNGEPLMMAVIERELIVSNRIGEVPTEIPKPPLQVDIEKQQKRLRLPPTADFKDYTLDLRKDTDLERSIFLHRLQLLEIKWGHRSDVSGKGTFKEQWRLQWDPAFSIDIIEKGNQGNTVGEAAGNYLIQQAREAASLSEVCALLENALPAELPAAVEILIQRINHLAAASADVVQLMEVIPGLVNVTRYGNVRKTDADLVLGIATSIIVRICISLPPACTNVDDDAAARLTELLFKLNESVNLLQEASILAEWQQALAQIASGKTVAPVIAGYATRLLMDYKLLVGEELVRRFDFAMSAATPPAIAAAWLEGFLKGSGTLLLLDNQLWSVVHGWVAGLDSDNFVQVLPLLRRTFSHYTNAERRKLGEKVRSGDAGGVSRGALAADFDVERAVRGIPVVMQLLGLPLSAAPASPGAGQQTGFSSRAESSNSNLQNEIDE
ncbi:MAG TPA: DUF5682 family protein [Puia sp.]|uniref:DUF5682 family protein n=1 Tax=Puia sp. TaxID=2045100 RepID=UPI002CBA4132|nr:DUF5682 family protein [Puia sp.]HVU95307.1 DUF5682 family protein [Puia sp.]